MSGLGAVPIQDGSILREHIATNAVGYDAMSSNAIMSMIKDFSTAGAVGSYGFFKLPANTSRAPGATVAGSALKFGAAGAASNYGLSATAVAGTWRVMGHNDASADGRYSLCIRIA